VGQWGKEVGDTVNAKEAAGISLGLLSLAPQCRGQRKGEDKSAEETEKELVESRLAAVSGAEGGTVSPGGGNEKVCSELLLFIISLYFHTSLVRIISRFKEIESHNQESGRNQI